MKPQSSCHYLPRSCPLLPLLECCSIQLGFPTPFFSHGHALASMSVACRPPCFAGILKEGSQCPHLRFYAPGRLLQLSRGLPTNLILDHPLTLSSWTPSFLLFFEYVAVQIAVLPLFLALLPPSHFVVLPLHCLFLRSYFHSLHYPHPSI